MAALPAGYSFQRASRLTQGVEFRRVFSRPVVSRDRFFRVLSRTNALPYARLGMAVSTKVDKRAVGRNRLKRLVRESFREHQHVLLAVDPVRDARSGSPAAPEVHLKAVEASLGLDFVVLPSREAATTCNERLNRALARHWRDSVAKHRSTHRLA